MQLVEKIPLKNNANINIGTIIKLNGIIGYETPTPDIVAFENSMKELETLYRADIIAIDVTSLQAWDTLGLRSIYPRLQKINTELKIKGKTPIVIIGSKELDPYDAAKERYPNTEALIPWMDSLEEFLRTYRLS